MVKPQKGATIRFISGKYAGLDGWVNDAESSDHKVTPVIVNRNRKGEKATFVYNSSFRMLTIEDPRTYSEAAMKQFPEVEKSVVTAARQLATFDLTEKNLPEFQEYLIKELDNAVDHQRKQASKARYRKVDWSP